MCVCVCVCVHMLQAGLGKLFLAGRLYDSDYHSLGLHVTPHCTVRPYTSCDRHTTEVVHHDDITTLPPPSFLPPSVMLVDLRMLSVAVLESL